MFNFSWNDDRSNYAFSENPYFIRGTSYLSTYSSGGNLGIFAFGQCRNGAHYDEGFRSALSVF